MNQQLKEVTIYTDGGADPNPGPGGYGVVLLCGKHRKELSGGFARTTNNRMEILAAIKGLEALKTPCRVRLHSDSQYLVNAMTLGWARRWQTHGWKRNRHDYAVNPDLWGRLLTLCDTHEVQFIWVKGHAGHRENERCDALAGQAIRKGHLPADEGYGAPLPPEARPQRPPVELDVLSQRVCEKFIPRGMGFEPMNHRQDADATKRHGQDACAASHTACQEKITRAGQPCRKCSTPVVKRTPHRHGRKAGQCCYYEYYLYCPKCCTLYMLEEAKRPYEP